MSGVQCLKREGCIVMLAFLGGIVLTNLLGANRQIHGQLLNQTFLQQYAYQKVDGNQLFGHVVMVRMQMLVLIFLLGRAVDGKVFSVLAKSMLSAGFGFLLVVGIMEYGGYGCLIILAGLLPQWIFIRRRCFSMRTVRKDRAESWDGTAGGSDAAAGGSGACDRLCVIGNVCGELCQSGSIRLGFKNFLLKFLK